MNKDKPIKTPQINTLTLIQNELNAPKNKTAPNGGYTYRKGDDILSALKPLLLKYNAVITLDDDTFMVGNTTYIKSTCTFRSNGIIEKVSSVAGIDLNDKFIKSVPQQFGSAITYARKNALAGMFSIDNEDAKDPDSIDYSNQPKQTNPTKTPETLKQLMVSVTNHYVKASADNKIPEKQIQKFDEYMANILDETDMKKMRGVRSALKKLINT